MYIVRIFFVVLKQFNDMIIGVLCMIIAFPVLNNVHVAK